MIRTTIEQKVVVENPVGKVFEAEFNKVMRSLAEFNPKTIYPDNVPGHCAYIVYTESIVEPEDARDELELKGIKPVCGQCPYYEAPGDGRVKVGRCLKALEPSPHYSKRACVFLCELVMADAVELEHHI